MIILDFSSFPQRIYGLQWVISFELRESNWTILYFSYYSCNTEFFSISGGTLVAFTKTGLEIILWISFLLMWHLHPKIFVFAQPIIIREENDTSKFTEFKDSHEQSNGNMDRIVVLQGLECNLHSTLPDFVQTGWALARDWARKQHIMSLRLWSTIR